ncbi:CoA ester lyase [Acidovorax sp. ACV01]|uniref:HpcH/HpaI aldolase/citrate lyase family protein n=1 Tax=Acidovorax sp. ACV01 TaxID=2769311 RepID=UPI001782371F|nr:CoA ester lyase [Acidovorax sp. ACV01]MBD9390689.1 CoA ester lyase [Acidovorax sp. ACV01]
MKFSSPLASARTLLFVPGNRPERFEKAISSGADAIVLDLEDSVPLAEKATARHSIAQAWDGLLRHGIPLVIRINPIGEGLQGETDLDWLASLTPPAGVMVPKVDSAELLDAVSRAIPTVPLLPLIESANGYLALRSISQQAHVLRLVVGHIDFMADTGIQCSVGEAELDPLRFEVTTVSRASQLASAIDGVTIDIHNMELLKEDGLRALRFGFGGKLCIHPKQVEAIHNAFAPTEEQLVWAERVLAADSASGGAAVQLDGRMVDVPVVLQAKKYLARAAR